MSKRRATITAVGHWVPERKLTNADLEKMVDTTDEWIRTRTGILERRILDNGATSDLAVGALRVMLERRGIGAMDLDLIIVATISPDMFFPSTACLVQEKIGAKNAWGFDLSAACSGFPFAMPAVLFSWSLRPMTARAFWITSFDVMEREKDTSICAAAEASIPRRMKRSTRRCTTFFRTGNRSLRLPW
jgi:3-hydroxy-3-methylglutaryl CoA synthase